MNKTLSLFTVLVFTFLTTFSFQSNANEDYYTTISNNFDHLLWSQGENHYSESYTILTVDRDGLVSKRHFKLGTRMEIRGRTYNIKKLNLYFDLNEGDRPFYSCKIDIEGEKKLYCSLHISGIKSFQMKPWTKIETDILGGTAKTSGIHHVIH